MTFYATLMLQLEKKAEEKLEIGKIFGNIDPNIFLINLMKKAFVFDIILLKVRFAGEFRLEPQNGF